ncbi:MAG: penicillin-binding protein [Thermodesulfobacteriota bacterium]
MTPGEEAGAPRERILIVAGGVAVLLLVMALRVAHLTIVERPELSARAQSQYVERIHMAAPRGQIRDREGTIFADTVGMPSIYASPRYHPVPQDKRAQLAAILDVPRATLDRKLDSKAGFVWLKRHATREQAAQVERLHLHGVDAILEGRRVYPLGTTASHVVGTAGVDLRGLEGIELRYDRWMRGQELVYRVERDGRGRSLFTQGVAAEETDERARGPLALDTRLEAGATLELTIDAGLQEMVERELAAGVQAANADAGTAVMLDPHTGAILALANYPWYDPNRPSEAGPDARRNRAVTDSFEPGSTLKAVLAAAAIDEGAVDADDQVFCENGKYKIGRWTINDHHPYGLLTVPEVIQYSSNIGVSKIAEKLGRERYFRYLDRFGFGHPTSVDLPGEVSGIVRPLDRWAQIDLATSSFGQGISVTAMQLGAAFAAIANGGRLYQPYLLERAVDPAGRVLFERDDQGPGAVGRDVIRPETAREIGAMLERVVEEEKGTGKKARVPGVRVAGKTGTAQKVDSRTRRYSNERLASFIGYAPADDPLFVTLVMIDNPKGVRYGGLVAAPVFSAIMSRALDRFGRRPVPLATIIPASLGASSSASAGAESAERRRARGDARGGKGERLRAGRVKDDVRTRLPFDGPVELTPSFVGLSLRSALREAHRLGLRLDARGSGFVVDQDPPAGTPLPVRSGVCEPGRTGREMCDGRDSMLVVLEPSA